MSIVVVNRRCRSMDSSPTNRTASASYSGGTATATSSGDGARGPELLAVARGCCILQGLPRQAGRAGRRPQAVRHHRRLEWAASARCPCRRGHPLGAGSMDRTVSGRPVHVRDGRRGRARRRDRERDRRPRSHRGRGRRERRQPGHRRGSRRRPRDRSRTGRARHGRPFFHGLESAKPVRLSEPRVVQGTGAVHLVYDVQEHSAGETSPQR